MASKKLTEWIREQMVAVVKTINIDDCSFTFNYIVSFNFKEKILSWKILFLVDPANYYLWIWHMAIKALYWR